MDAPELPRELAVRALVNFPIQPVWIEPLRHSDNLTWRVEDRARQIYLLRIHRAVSASLAGARQKPECIRSELVWLQALAESGFEVQRPVAANSQDFIAPIEMDGMLVASTLLSWLEGENYDPERHARPEIARSHGSLMARLHTQAGSWTPPRGFVRPPQDAAHFERLFSELKKGLQWGLVQAEDWPVLRETCERLVEVMRAAESIPGQWGLIHADLQSGNILVRGARVLPIDFSLCGWGSFLFDISIALAGGMPAELRPAFLEGYRAVRALPGDLLPLVDSCGLVGVLGYCSFQVENPANHEWLVGRLPRLAANECAHFLAGERLFLEA
jgi:Ser/Thr protein kinase RdoA (MazF antagonist)